jgi:hypothetical protein
MKTAVALAVLGLCSSAPERLVFLGDSITDGHTLPLLVRQSLGDRAPVCINAGQAGDTAAGMRKRLERDVFLNTGADLQLITLNGVLLWKNEGWTGWHAGKERLAARLAAGSHRIRIETGPAFFLSVTDENSW